VNIPFLKIHGCKNSFVIIKREDIASLSFDELGSFEEFVTSVCDAGSGIGADGVFLVTRVGGELEVDMRNPDGGFMGMCGNGVRCVVRAAYEWGWQGLQNPLPVTIGKRRVECFSFDEGKSVRVAMGPVSFEPKDIPILSETPILGENRSLAGRTRRAWCVSMGNPHCVLIDEGEKLAEVGPIIENDSLFPSRTNVEFITPIIMSKIPLQEDATASLGRSDQISVRVWERGAGITKACGTGACASAVVAIMEGWCGENVFVDMPGGRLEVSWDRTSNQVYLTGPTELTIVGELIYP
jgi:diaminopimelate epimerase